jgi:hypothetical protein
VASGRKKYARRSLNTRHQGTAIERGRDLYLDIMARLRQGKRYFSINAKQAAERYLAHRQRDVAAGLIVPGRLATMRAHLNHWQDFVGRDTRLSELDRGSCEDYHRSRLLGARGVAARQVTIANEQSTINAMMLWPFRQGDSQIDGFDFPDAPAGQERRGCPPQHLRGRGGGGLRRRRGALLRQGDEPARS